MAMVDEALAKQGTFPLDNMSYDLVCLIYEKSKGLEALDRYLQDVAGDEVLNELFLQIRAGQARRVQELAHHLVERLSRLQGGQAAGGVPLEVEEHEDISSRAGAKGWPDLHDGWPKSESEVRIQEGEIDEQCI